MCSMTNRKMKKPKPLIRNHNHMDFLTEKMTAITNGLGNTQDLSFRDLYFNSKVLKIVHINSIVQENDLYEFVVRPLLENPQGKVINIIGGSNIDETTDHDVAISGLAEGRCLLLEDDSEVMTLVTVPVQSSSQTVEPENEKVIRGSHRGFGGDLTENISYIRQWISSEKLTIKHFLVGKNTRTKIALIFISDLANEEIVKEVVNRIDSIDSEDIQLMGQLEEYVEDYAFSPFPQLLNTERPDRVVGNILEGRVALLMEEDPTSLVFPISFFSFFQTSEDYNIRSTTASFFRLIRLLSYMTTLCLPAIYIAVISYNYEVIPVEIIFSIKNSLEYLPFPPLIEAAIMQFTLELIREAAIRLPNPIAQTIGVVGGLVIGNAVVQAHFVSNTMVIVVAITAISSFVIPSNELSTSIRILGFPLMVMASLFGFFGIIIGLMMILIHLATLTSLSHPYLYPLVPLDVKALRDTVIRLPIWMINKRPENIKNASQRRQTNDSN